MFYFRPLQSSREVLTFQTEYPPPPGSNIPVRPFGSGCSNLYCSDRLLQFLKATHVKFNFYNHTLVQNPLHRYYGLERILVTGRLANSWRVICGQSFYYIRVQLLNSWSLHRKSSFVSKSTVWNFSQLPGNRS